MNSPGLNLPINLRHLALRHPEWRVWLASLGLWGWLILQLFSDPHKSHTSVAICGVFCKQTVPQVQPLGMAITNTLFNGLWPWTIMVIAMMFPLLNEPVRHLSFSVKYKDRNGSVLAFLTAYTLIWIVAGLLFLLIPVLLQRTIGQSYWLQSAGFIAASLWACHPYRAIQLSQCGQTRPIRIQNPFLLHDSVIYGFRTGAVCLAMCWLPMLALMFMHHQLLIMGAVTLILTCERYHLQRKSKLIVYGWATLALIILYQSFSNP